MIKLGDNNVTLKLGSNDVSKVYLGENQIYPSVSPISVSLERISSTQYVVNGSGSASLKFKRISDDAITDLGMQTLPYTFTHTIGERYEVSANNSPYVFDNNIRYIRSWGNRNDSNTGNHWFEVWAYSDNVNKALNKPTSVSSNASLRQGGGMASNKAVDGIADGSTNTYASYSNDDGNPMWLQIDLESVQPIDNIEVLKTNIIGRVYYDNKLEVGKDLSTLITIFEGDIVTPIKSIADVKL